MQGSNLLHKLTKPNGMMLTQSYEASRDLLTGMAYHRGSTLVVQREYTYDVLRRPSARTTSRQGNVVNDTFVHNSRSELVAAQVNNKDYEYTFDNIGNRTAAVEYSSGVANSTEYTANELNQYMAITEDGAAGFIPQFDADGNQTLIKTETGVWSAVYNAGNRPVTFTNSESNTVVECQYDSMGRRVFKKVISGNGTVTSHQRFIYRGYLQIACVDLTRTNHPCLWLITWDPTQPIATRPLAIQKDGTWYTYGLDLTKNVCEVFGSTGYIATAYTYSPYGSVTATGNVTQPIQWSSEIWDSDLNLVCYNARYYSTNYGRWINRDYAEIDVCFNLLVYCNNSPIYNTDILGLKSECVEKIIITYDTILATSDEVILFDKGVRKRWNSMSNVSFEDDALVAKKRKRPYQIEHPDIIHKKGSFSMGHYYSGNVFKGTIQFIFVDKDREPCSFNMQVGGRAQDFMGVKGDNTALNVNGQIDSTLSSGKTIRGFRVLDTEGQAYIMDQNNEGKKRERKGIFLHKTPIAIPAQPNHIKQLGSHGCFSIPNDEDWKNIVNILDTHNKHCKEKKIDFEIKNNIDFSKPHQSQLDEETRKLINDGKQ